MRLAINYKFTPAHRSTSDFLAAVIMFVFSFTYENNSIVLFGLFGYVICLIGSLIYNEIVIITIEQIQMRGLLEEADDKQYLSDGYKKQKQYLADMAIKNNNKKK